MLIFILLNTQLIKNISNSGGAKAEAAIRWLLTAKTSVTSSKTRGG
jgi:hypothetical protein